MGEVYYVNADGSQGDGLLERLKRLCREAGLENIITPQDLVAIKMHFGELGNTRMIRPQYLKVLIQLVKAMGGKPFLTDCNTLFYRNRFNAVLHLTTAAFNGFDLTGMGAPVIVADGLRGLDYRPVRFREGLREAAVGAAIYEADKLLTVTHFKGHDDTGFGGIIKNLGMGAIARTGKQSLHSWVKPVIDQDLCDVCQDCLEVCTRGAIIDKSDMVVIEPDLCSNCGHCLVVCTRRAIPINWENNHVNFQKSLVESCAAVLANKLGKSFFISFVMDITAYCDCRSWSPLPIIGDIGITAGMDPVSVEQASYDLVNRKISLAYPGKSLSDFTGVNGEYMLAYAEELGLGSREYRIIEL